MTKREAVKLVKRIAAVTMRSDVDNDSGWIADDRDGNERSEADRQRILDAIDIVAEQLDPERRGFGVRE